MATSFQRTVPELLLCRYKVVETFHAAEQEQRAEKFEIGKLGNTKGAERVLGWGQCGGGRKRGKKYGTMWESGKMWEKGSVTILAPSSPYPNPPDHNSPDP